MSLCEAAETCMKSLVGENVRSYYMRMYMCMYIYACTCICKRDLTYKLYTITSKEMLLKNCEHCMFNSSGKKILFLITNTVFKLISCYYLSYLLQLSPLDYASINRPPQPPAVACMEKTISCHSKGRGNGCGLVKHVCISDCP